MQKKIENDNHKLNITIMKNTKQLENNNVKPFIKWCGGKTQIINDVIEKFPTKINNYHEIFLGGGSVLFSLLQNIKNNKIILKKEIYAYDINETLINLYINIQKNPNELIKHIQIIINEYNNIVTTEINHKPLNINEAKTSKESYYYWIRKQFNLLNKSDKNKIIGSIYFIFLNKTCFRGIYREGPNGFNVPFGHYKNPEIINENNVITISNLIKNVNFIHSDFKESFKNINKKDFIYLDPPYAPINNKSFVGYVKDGFTLEQHNELFEICKKFNFLMSNSDVDLVKNNFTNKKKFNIKIISCKRSINSKKPDSKVNEVLIKSL
jgi:DNA adenine methylase